MKKRSLGMLIALVVAFSLLAVTAYASTPTYKGYAAFKALAKNHEDHFESNQIKDRNETINGHFVISDNDSTRIELETVIKKENANKKSAYLQIVSDNLTKELNVFAEGDQMYIYDRKDERYYAIDKKAMGEDYKAFYDEENLNGEDYFDNKYDEMTKGQEELLDFVMGDLKDDFEVDKHSDGSETISFELTKEEVPMLINLILSAADSHEKRTEEYEEFKLDKALLEKYPILKDFVNIKDMQPEINKNIELEYIQVAITTLENQFVDMQFDVILTGDDEVGTRHNVQIQGAFALSNIGTTYAEDLDLMDKEIIKIDSKDFEQFNKASRIHERR